MVPYKLVAMVPSGDFHIAKTLECRPDEVLVWFVIWGSTPAAITGSRMHEITLDLELSTQHLPYEVLHQLVKARRTSRNITWRFSEGSWNICM